MDFKWYIVHVYSGYENKVQQMLEERIKESELRGKFGEIIVPTEQVVELSGGKRKESSRKFYPGYILIQMELSEETWILVKGTTKVTDFLCSQNKPVPISEKEVEAILKRIEMGKKRPKPKIEFQAGDEIRVIGGPFANFNGVVDETNYEKGKLRALVSIFGRPTPVELDFVQVVKQ